MMTLIVQLPNAYKKDVLLSWNIFINDDNNHINYYKDSKGNGWSWTAGKNNDNKNPGTLTITNLDAARGNYFVQGGAYEYITVTYEVPADNKSLTIQALCADGTDVGGFQVYIYEANKKSKMYKIDPTLGKTCPKS